MGENWVISTFAIPMHYMREKNPKEWKNSSLFPFLENSYLFVCKNPRKKRGQKCFDQRAASFYGQLVSAYTRIYNILIIVNVITVTAFRNFVLVDDFEHNDDKTMTKGNLIFFSYWMTFKI